MGSGLFIVSEGYVRDDGKTGAFAGLDCRGGHPERCLITHAYKRAIVFVFKLPQDVDQFFGGAEFAAAPAKDKAFATAEDLDNRWLQV